MASVKVAVRVRPFNQREKDMNAKLIVQMEGKKTRLLTPKTKEQSDRERYKDFTFDHSYWSYDDKDSNYASQEQVFSDLGIEVIDSAFEGYNACVFAYGQTGSGKTFTMMGSMENQGLIPRICRNLFARVASGKESGASYRTEVSYLEIYNERVKDLLGGEVSHSLRVREHPKLGPYVQDLSKHLVSDYDDIQECMHRGNLHRTTASTQMNDVSSRSHAIFTINFVQASYLKHNNMPSETVSKVHLVDLAGSERADATGATGQRLVEGAHINKSLVTLGSVISALADSSSKAKPSFIPYRDSVLTWLLKDSLGGNSKTIMIAAISPADCNYGETLSTLRYANRAKNIINTPTINEDPNVKLIRELRNEIEKLRSQIGVSVGDPVQAEPQVLATLQKKEAQEKVLTEKWTEKWRETQQILQEQKALGLRKSGHGVVLDSDMPHLVGIDDNLLSTGVTLYHLKEGETLIGTDDGDSVPDIVLSGAGVMSDHCRITLQDGVATIFPRANAQCWLNTVLIDKPTKLSQGCILLLGRTNMFRYNDPAEAAKLRREGSASVLNLSRLSLLSWSTTDLDASDLEGDIKTYDIETQRAELMREREQFQKQQEERQKKWRHEKDLLEEAQRRLEEERRRMERELRRPTATGDGVSVDNSGGTRRLRVRQRELSARTKRLRALRSAHSDMMDKESEKISALEKEIADKQNILGDIIKNSIRELLEQGYSVDKMPDPNVNPLSDEASECFLRLLDQCSPEYSSHVKENYNRYKDEMEELENELSSRSASVKCHLAKVNSLDTDLALAQAQQLGLAHTLRCSPYDDDESFEPPIVTRSKSELLLNIKHIHEPTALSDTEKDVIKAKKLSFTLDLNGQNNWHSHMDDTFHTATSTISPIKPFSPNSNVNSPTTFDRMSTTCDPMTTSCDPMTTSGELMTASVDRITSDEENDCDRPKLDFKLGPMMPTMDDSDEMSSTEDYNKSRRTNGQSSSSGQEGTNGDGVHHRGKYKRRLTTGRRRQVTEAEALRAMQRLCQRVAQQKMLVISSLENDCSKEELNRQIAVLQELQKRYVRLEMALQYSFFDNNNSSRSRALMVTPIQEMPSLTLSESDMQVTTEPLQTEESDDINDNQPPIDPLIQRLKEEVEASDNLSTSNEELMSTDAEFSEADGWSECLDDPLRRFRAEIGIDNAIGDVVHGPVRPLPINGSVFDRPIDFSRIISVPSYVTRGAGARTHYEYEIRIDLGPGQRWALLRRYRRFRDLYLTMKATYGAKVASIPFPPRHLWSSDSIARSRRPTLEAFLRRLLNVCSVDKRCPFHAQPLTKETLIQFSPFFQKGVFETGKSGTG